MTFAKVLRTPILQNMFERRGYLCENICHMKLLANAYLTKYCLPWCLLSKQKKCVFLSEVSKVLGIYKKAVPLN